MMGEVLLALQNRLEVAVPMQQGMIRKAFADLDSFEIRELEALINIYKEEVFLADSYAFFVQEINQEQMEFYRMRTNYNRTPKDFARRVYADKEYMKRYMAGLAVSMFVWERHRMQYRFFRSFFESEHTQELHYMEIGAGHGLYSRAACLLGSFQSYEFVDISETGLYQTKEALHEMIPDYSMTFHECDLLDFSETKQYDFICAGEVVQAVSDIRLFLKKLNNLTKIKGVLFLTAPFYSAVPDNVEVLKDVKKFENITYEAGLKIVRRNYIPYNHFSVEETITRELPLSAGYFLQKYKGVETE